MKRGIRGRLQALAEWLWAGSVVAGLTACGGGGGGAGTPPPPAEPSVPDAIVQAVAKAELRAYSTPSANKAELKWTDWIEGETGFRIDKSVNGSWTPVATLAANANQPRGMGWAGTLDAAATPYRVVALLAGGKEVALKSPAGLTELKLGPAPAGASIALSTAEPLKGEVKLSITGAPEAQSAGFYVDQRPDALPISGGKPNFETPWSTYPEADGGHKIRSLLQYAPDSFVEIERTVTVANPDLSVTIVPRISPWSPQAAVFVIPISRSGATTASASLSVDGRAVGTRTVLDCYFLNIANPCLPAYAFSLNTADYDFGSHALVARVVDAQGGETLATAPMIKAIPLAVTMASPGPVRFSGPRLQVRGELTGDTAYPASLAINLDGRSLLQRDGYGPFNADFDLTGLPDAIYRLTTTAVGVNGRVGSTTDDSRLVLWQSTPPMSYEWVRDGVNWLAASGRDGVLMRASDSDGGGANLLAEWLRVGDPSVTLADSIAGTEFRYANGQWIGFARDLSLRVWGADGKSRSLTGPFDQGFPGEQFVTGFSTAGNKVGWLESTATRQVLQLSDLATLAPVSLPLSGDPTKFRAGALSLGVGVGGAIVAAYEERSLDAQGRFNGGAVFAYDTVSNSHRQLSDPATVAASLVTDGKRVAWTSAPNAVDTPADLWIAAADGSGSPQRLSAAANSQPQWADGLLVWTESAGSGVNTVKVYRDGAVSTLLTQFGAKVLAVGSGAVAYVGGKRLLVWTPDKGERVVHGLFEGQGYGSVAMADGWLYFTVASTAHRVRL